MRLIGLTAAVLLVAACGGAEGQKGSIDGPDASRDVAISIVDAHIVDHHADDFRLDHATPDEPPDGETVLDGALRDADVEATKFAGDAGDAEGGEPEADVDAGCVDLANIAAPVDEVMSTDPEPVASGGPIVDGTYIATSITNYGDVDAGYNIKGLRETILISNGTIQLVRDSADVTPPHLATSATYVVANSTLFLTYTCNPLVDDGTQASGTAPYTSTVLDGGAVELVIHDHQQPTVVAVFSRQ